VEVVKEERAVLLGHLVAAQDSLGCAQAEAAREDGARSEVEAEAWLQLAGAASSSVMEALKSVLERSGGVLPFLQAAIDVAHHGSGLFRDPSAVSKVTSMAAAIRAQMEAKERAAREAERKAPPAEEPESSVEDCICMVVDKKQATVAEQVAELEATTAELKGRSLKLEMSKLERHLKASRVSACSVQSQKREKSSISKNKKENEVYKQEMEVQFHEQLKELEAVQSSQVEQKHVALVTEVATLQSEINQEKDKVKKLVEYFTAKELVELAQIFLAKSSELMSVSQGSNGGENFSSGDDTSTVLGNLVNLARPSTGTFNANWILDSGASRHVTGTLDEFASYNSFYPTCKETIQTADGTAQPIRGVGTVKCTPSITLSTVLYVPSFPVNLVSISALVDQMDCRVTLDRENCLIEDRKTGRMLGSGIRRNGLWFLDRRIDNSTCTALAISTSEEETKVILQHCRLGHMSFDTMSRAFPDIMSKVDKKSWCVMHVSLGNIREHPILVKDFVAHYLSC
jgi:hypothetical protein